MSLTPELVARIHREVPDPGLMQGLEPMQEADYDRLLDDLLLDHPREADLWLFVYGSLIWKPACDVDGQQRALLRGWRRSFCMRLTRFRGTAEFPGLMMALDRGGACIGVAQRLPATVVRERLGQLLRRETSVKPPTNCPRWVTVESAGQKLRAIAFAADRSRRNYVREQSHEVTADILARAVGHWGTGAEYLMQTVLHLEKLGIHDRYLWKLQEMVAARIRAQDRAQHAAI
jgi:cation transport protein ChaC